MAKCYMCDAEGTTREHVPPRSFFPADQRLNLITVPSCETHNNGNSADVEYVRNIIVNHYETNAVARAHFKNKISPLYKKSTKLTERTFRIRKHILIDGKETIVFQIDLPKFRAVMKAIAYATFHKDYGKSFNGNWLIYSPSMVATKLVFGNLRDNHNPLIRKLLLEIPFVEKQVNNPKVFRYFEFSELDSRNRIIYKFDFYEGFIVNALSL